METTSLKDYVKSFVEHGFSPQGETETQSIGACPLCGRDRKFYIEKETGVWDCKVCGESGNLETFLGLRHQLYLTGFAGSVVERLCESRHLRPQTLRAWGVGWSGRFYTIPLDGNPKRRLLNLYRYNPGEKCLSTYGAKLTLIAPKEVTGSTTVWLCEGPWDGMAWWEVLRRLGIQDDVIAAPGAQNLPKSAMELFHRKDVVVLYDNDGPGKRGAERVLNLLDGYARRVRVIAWEDTLPEGYDIRDLYIGQKREAKKTHQYVLSHLSDESSGGVGGGDEDSEQGCPAEPQDQEPPPEIEEIERCYRKWLKMPNTRCLSVLFGSALANRLEGDPLWLFFVAPPGGMKSELLMSISDAPYIVPKTTLTVPSLISGVSFAGGGDPSLIPQLDQKILLVKDFTTILSMNTVARDEIFGILRDAYDGRIEKSFGNGITRSYESHFGLVAGVTPIIESLHALNTSLGERFLKYRLDQGITSQDRQDAIRQALRNLVRNDEMRTELASVGFRVLNRKVRPEDVPSIPEEMIERFVTLAHWLSYLRSVISREKYSGLVMHKPFTEVGTRLAKQLAKLALGIGIYRGERVISTHTYEVVKQVTRDTAPDRVEEVIRVLYMGEEDYQTTKEVSAQCHLPVETVRFLLQDLVLLHLVEKTDDYEGFWRLNASMRGMIQKVQLYRVDRGANA